MTTNILNFLLYYILYDGLILLHELGHAMAYKFAYKDDRWRIEIGRGKKS